LALEKSDVLNRLIGDSKAAVLLALTVLIVFVLAAPP
jgi:hypothetical protein